METIRGKVSLHLDWNELNERLKNCQRVVLDLGTGDGRFVRYLADRHPGWLIIGVDSCRENLREHSRAEFPNALFVIAGAQDLPHELRGLVSHVTINFPWGSLLESLLTGDLALMQGLAAIATPNAQVDILLNGGALEEAGTSLEVGAQAIYNMFDRYGWDLGNPLPMDHQVLRAFPSTWAKRLAYGRDPRAIALNGTFAR